MDTNTKMIDQREARRQVLNEIANRQNLGNKKYHSENSLQQYGEDEGDVFYEQEPKDPGVHNASLTDLTNAEDVLARRRTMSQPGPVSGGLITATAARAARKRPPKNVMYAPEMERSVNVLHPGPHHHLPSREIVVKREPIEHKKIYESVVP